MRAGAALRARGAVGRPARPPRRAPGAGAAGVGLRQPARPRRRRHEGGRTSARRTDRGEPAPSCPACRVRASSWPTSSSTTCRSACSSGRRPAGPRCTSASTATTSSRCSSRRPTRRRRRRRGRRSRPAPGGGGGLGGATPSRWPGRGAGSWPSTTRPPRADLAQRPWTEWVRTYRGHATGRPAARGASARRTSPARWRSTSCRRRRDRVAGRLAAGPRHRRPVAEGRDGRSGPPIGDLAAVRARSRVGRPRRSSTRPASAPSASSSGGARRLPGRCEWAARADSATRGTCLAEVRPCRRGRDRRRRRGSPPAGSR